MKGGYKYLLLIVSGAVLFLLCLTVGTTFIGPARIFSAVAGNGMPGDAMIIGLRVPRLLMSLIIGASLATSGVVFQAILKNPLADPYLIGVSGGGALGATIAIVLSLQYPFVVAAAFAGSLAVVSAVFLMSRRMRFGTTTLVLSGIALSFIFSSSVLLLFSFAGPDKVHKAVMWLMGDMSIARYEMLPEMGLLCFVLVCAAAMFHRHLDVLSFGDAFSGNLGVTRGSMRILFWTASLLSAVSVALCGVVAFVGLIIPHFMRLLVGPSHRRLIPASVLGGAIFLMVTDSIGRAAVPPYEIPVGVITGFLGGIFFLLYLTMKKDYPV